MALPDFSMRQLLEAGAHFGHQSHRWNPKMAPYIFGARNNIHILDLAQTVPMLYRALQAVSDTVANGGRVLFVGTKRQAADLIADSAKRSAQYYVNHRWLGGMLTNWKTISGSISRLRKVDELLAGGAQGLTKKERLMMSRERENLEKALGGIRDMGGIRTRSSWQSRRRNASVFRLQRLSIRIAIRMGLRSRSRAMTMLGVRSRCIVICLRVRHLTVFHAAKALPALILGLWKSRLLRNCRLMLRLRRAKYSSGFLFRAVHRTISRR